MSDRLEAGSKAPDFNIFNQDNKKVSLADFKGKWVVLYFYPKDNTPGCTTEAVTFSQCLSEFHEKNCEVVGISKDSIDSHCKFIKKHSLKVTLLSDTELEMMKNYSAYGKKKFMGKEYMGTIRSTFIVDPDGIIKKAWYNVRVKGHVDKVKEALSEFVG